MTIGTMSPGQFPASKPNFAASSLRPGGNQPKFSALICHNEGNKRCPETGVRIFRYELTNSNAYPLGRVLCPQSGLPGLDHAAVAEVSRNLPQLALLPKETRLEAVRNLIRQDSANWQIGKNQPGDLKGECLADRGARLLQESSADIVQTPDGSLSMIMDYEPDPNETLTEKLQKRAAPQFAGQEHSIPMAGSRFQALG